MNCETDEVACIPFEIEVLQWANAFLAYTPNASFDLLLRRVRPLYGWRVEYMRELIVARWLELNPQLPA